MESIATLYSESLDRFELLLSALQEDNCRAVKRKQVDLPKLSEDLAHFKLWGEQLGANLPEGARYSLDRMLRHSEVFKYLVRGPLEELRSTLKKAIAAVQPKDDPDTEYEHDCVLSFSDDSDSEAGSTKPRKKSSTIAAAAWCLHALKICRKTPKLTAEVPRVHERVQFLERIHDLLPDADLSEDCVRSIQEAADGSPLASLREYDYNHVFQKVLHWRKSRVSKPAIPNWGEATKTGEMIRPRENSSNLLDEEMFLIKRLAEANTMRREQLQYWSEHPVQANDKVPLLFRSTHKSAEMGGAGDHANERPKPSAQVLGIPQAVDEEEFECPYCHQKLNTESMKNEENWTRHIYLDLQPYQCIWERCPDSNILYSSRDLWLDHQTQAHGHRWACNQNCSMVYEDVFSARRHLLKCHHIPEKEVNTVVTSCGRRAKENEKAPCTLCGDVMTLGKLYPHLAYHLEEIALFILPDPTGNDEGGSSMPLQGLPVVSTVDPETISVRSSIKDNEASEEAVGPALADTS